VIHFHEARLHEKMIRFVPHCLMPDEIHDLIATEMSKRGCGIFDSCPRGVFLPYEVGAATPEGMTDAMKVLEPWLISVGVKERGEVVLLEWDW